MVTPFVTRRRIIIPYLDALYIKRVASRWWWNWGHTRRPRIISVGVPCIPQSNHRFHRCLRILIGRPNAVGCIQCTHDVTVSFPHSPFSRPVKCVGVKLCHRRRNLWGNRMIVKPSDAFPKPARLYLVIESASELPVQLVKVIGQCHHIANDPWAWCCLDDKLHPTEKKVEATE